MNNMGLMVTNLVDCIDGHGHAMDMDALIDAGEWSAARHIARMREELDVIARDYGFNSYRAARSAVASRTTERWVEMFLVV